MTLNGQVILLPVEDPVGYALDWRYLIATVIAAGNQADVPPAVAVRLTRNFLAGDPKRCGHPSLGSVSAAPSQTPAQDGPALPAPYSLARGVPDQGYPGSAAAHGSRLHSDRRKFGHRP